MNALQKVLVLLIAMSAFNTGVFAQDLMPAHGASTVNPTVDLNHVAVKVNGAPVSERDVQEAMQKLFPYYAVHGGKVPAAYQAEIRQKAVNQLVVEELAYQEARRRGLTVPRTEIRKALREASKGFRTTTEYDSWARQRYGSKQAFEHQVERARMIAKLWDLEVTRKGAVMESELRAYYRQNRQRFVRPESVALQTISVLLPEGGTDEQRRQAKKRAEEILPKARATKSYEEFGILAEKYSNDDWRVMMGDHKFVHRGALAPQLERVAFDMGKGNTSGVVEVPNGYVIMRVNDKTQTTQLPFAAVREHLRDEMQRTRTADRAKAFERNLRAKAKIEQTDSRDSASPAGR